MLPVEDLQVPAQMEQHQHGKYEEIVCQESLPELIIVPGEMMGTYNTNFHDIVVASFLK